MADDGILSLFPTPLMVARGTIPPDLVAKLIAEFDREDRAPNVRTALLSHTPVSTPGQSEAYRAVMGQVMPKLRQFGEALLGESLAWGVKEIWVNRMETGGAQKLHNHANSFISGIIYLTEVHPSASTVFYRQIGQSSFQMSNENKNCTMGPFNSPVFRAPATQPGDMILFPSYMHHEVPPNQGGPRYTAAFNALPERIDSWGYSIRFR